jgi:hypothetical protein
MIWLRPAGTLALRHIGSVSFRRAAFGIPETPIFDSTLTARNPFDSTLTAPK